MNQIQIFSALADIASELPVDRCESIANRIKTVQGPADEENIDYVFGNVDKALKAKFKEAWRNTTPIMEAKDISLALRSASITANLLRKKENQQLVWTGPESESVFARKTETVMIEVISRAKHNLFLASYVFYQGESTNLIIQAINEAIKRGVDVKILLEAPRGLGGTMDNDGLLKMRNLSPNASFLIWNPDVKPEIGNNPKVHAKCVVADKKIAFITSANLTEAAMENNMEAGVLIHGGEVPVELHKHLEGLHNENVLAPID